MTFAVADAAQGKMVGKEAMWGNARPRFLRGGAGLDAPMNEPTLYHAPSKAAS